MQETISKLEMLKWEKQFSPGKNTATDFPVPNGQHWKYTNN